MIADLKPYPAMKDSGVLWLGEVPEHWEVRRLKQAFRRIAGGSTPSSTEVAFWDGDVVWVTPADVSKTDRLRNSMRRITRDGLMSCSAELIPAGSIVVTSRAPVGNVALTEAELCTNQGCKALVANDEVVNPVFGFHVLKTLNGELQSLASGTTFTEISTNRLGTVVVPLPPLPEQAVIVRFLDYVDRRIRRYIRAKQKLVKLLEEQKQAIIHRAVTRGLDPNVRLKPSGVEWLGDVPEHWEVHRIQQVTDAGRPVMYGIVLPGPNVDDGVWIVKGGNCEPGRLRQDRLSKTTYEIELRYVRSRLVGDDIVFAIRGGVGAAEIVPDDLAGANLTQDAARIAPKEGVHPKWLLYAVRAPMFQSQIQSMVIGATVRGINIRDLRRAQLVLPPITEQSAVAEQLDRATAEIASAAARAEREISLLREYRTRLIADVVTGKLDVREAAARLPDEVEEPEPPDEADSLTGAEDTIADDLDAVPEEVEG